MIRALQLLHRTGFLRAAICVATAVAACSAGMLHAQDVGTHTRSRDAIFGRGVASDSSFIAPVSSLPPRQAVVSGATHVAALIANRGQVIDARGAHRPDILYMLGGGNLNVYLRASGISYVFSRRVPLTPALRSDNPAQAAAPARYDQYRMDMELVGANANPTVVAGDAVAAYTNYYLPQCPSGLTHVPGYARVTYRDIYPHIDLVVYAAGDHLEYDFVVHPGGVASDIRWRYIGAGSGSIGPDGSLTLTNPLGKLDEAAPYAYQSSGTVGCRYMRDGEGYAFKCYGYDRSADLVIDPTVQWTSYWGGAGAENTANSGNAITANAAGEICAIGTTESLNFPVTAGAMQSTMNGISNFAISKVSSGGALVWSTYWGGTNIDVGSAIACDNGGNVAVAGSVWSIDFPITFPAYQSGHSIGAGTDVVVGMLDPTGARIWATYLGGSAAENARCVAVDSAKNLIVCGEAQGPGFPTRSAMQSTFRGVQDGIIAKFNSKGALQWSTYYGGSGSDIAFGVAADINGEIAVCGSTASTNLTLAGTPFRSTGSGADAFVMRLTPNGAAIWATYYGGTGTTDAFSVGIDPASAEVVTGHTNVANLPVTGSSVQPANGGGAGDCFVTKFDAMGQHLWSTYYGGIKDESGRSVAFADADILIAGETRSTNLTMAAGAYQTTLHGMQDGYFIQLDPLGQQLKWSTYFGGTGVDAASSIVFSAGNVYMLGSTQSNDLPATAGTFQPAYSGNTDGYIAKFSGFCPAAKASIDVVGPVVLCEGDSIRLTAASGFTNYHWGPNNETAQTIIVKRTGAYTVTATDGNSCTTTSRAVQIRVAKKPVPVITPAGPVTICLGDSVQLSAKQNGLVKYTWSNGDTLDHIWVRQAGTFSVSVVDTNGCTGTSAASVTVQVNPRPLPPSIAPADTIRICTDSVLRLDAGAGYASYRWSPGGESSRIIQARAGGLYFVDVGNGSGCKVRSDSVMVLAYPTVPARLVVDGVTTFCFGDSVTLHAPAGAFTAPKWSNGSLADSVVIRAGGLYYVTVVDSNGCHSRSDTVRVTVRPQIRADIAGPARVCKDAAPTYSTTSAGQLRYAWSVSGDGTVQGASGGKSIVVAWGASGGGTITLVVTDTVTGCSATGTRDVTIGTSLKPVITPASPIVICAGDSVELDAGQGYTSYAWSNGSASEKIWVKDSAAYSVAVTDASGCSGRSDTVRATIEARPVPAIDGPLKVCLSTSASYSVSGASGATYAWRVNGGAISGGDGTPAITVQWGAGPAGAVDVTVTSAGGCGGDAAQVAVEIGSSLKPAVTPGGTLSLCAGDSIELDAGAGYATYQWSSGEASEKIVVRAPGAYAVSVTDAGGCSGISDSVHVTQSAAPVVTIAPAGPVTLRAGDSVVLDAGAGYAAYRWRLNGADAGTARALVARDSGSYSVSVTDANGCRGSASVRVDVSGSGSAELALGDVSAQPGDHISVPLRLVSSTNLGGSGVTSYEARVRYRAAALATTGATPAGTLAGSDRVVTIGGPVPAGMTAGELGHLDFIAALGDSQEIALQLEKITWTGAGGAERSIATVLHGGRFTLVGLCTQGGRRLVSAAGATGLKSVVPNPSGGEIRIDYTLAEDGYSSLVVTDMLGRRIAELAAGAREHGNYTATFDASRCQSGMYVVVLQTSTERASGILEVVR